MFFQSQSWAWAGNLNRKKSLETSRKFDLIMLTDEGLIRFFQNSGKRVQDLTNTAANLKHIEFYEAIEELKKVVEGSEVYFYGTRAMQLGHRKSHLNIFYDFGEFNVYFFKILQLTLKMWVIEAQFCL